MFMCRQLPHKSSSCYKHGYVRLEAEMKRLKNLLGLGYDLKIEWLPSHAKQSGGKPLSGEVLGDVVYIYDAEIGDALKTLKHELVDCSISEVINCYREVCNMLIKKINDDAYKKKEKLVKALTRLI